MYPPFFPPYHSAIMTLLCCDENKVTCKASNWLKNDHSNLPVQSFLDMLDGSLDLTCLSHSVPILCFISLATDKHFVFLFWRCTWNCSLFTRIGLYLSSKHIFRVSLMSVQWMLSQTAQSNTDRELVKRLKHIIWLIFKHERWTKRWMYYNVLDIILQLIIIQSIYYTKNFTSRFLKK